VSPPLKLWVAGARPRTLPAAIVPSWWAPPRLPLERKLHSTVLGELPRRACADFDRQLSWLNAILALIVALGIQIGTNYVNDYADGCGALTRTGWVPSGSSLGSWRQCAKSRSPR